MEAGGIRDASNVDVPVMTTKGDCKLQQGDSTPNGPNCDPNMKYVCKPDDVLRNLKNVSYIFRQDVVESKTDGKIGIVTEAPGDSDSDSGISDDEGEEEEEDEAKDEEENDSNEEGDLENNDKADGCTGGNMDSNHNNDHLLADQVRVLWMDETESIQRINDVTVIDRGFLPGDYVAAVADPTGQVGLVVDINIYVNLLTHDGSFVKDISTRELKRVRDFTVGDYVVFGPWLGRIDDVLDNVTVMFDDGSLCKVMKADPLRLKPVGRNSLEDGSFPYYPGQRVKAISSSVFKNSRWLSGFWKASRLEGTVTKVTVGSVFIYWIASAGYGPDSSTPPAQEQSPKNLKFISCFAHANWQLGDWCLLPSPPPSSSILLDQGFSKLGLNDSTKEASESAQTGADCDSEGSHCNSESIENDADSSLDWSCDNLENKVPLESSSSGNTLHVSKEPIHESWPIHRRKIRRAVVRRDKKARKKENFERALLIVNTKSHVDIAWQDGTIERGLKSTSLIPIDNPGDHEFVAEQYVVEKAADDAENVGETRRIGVVRSVNAKERTACVRWLKPVARAEDPKEFDNEEVVSVYELEGHPDYDYCYGDVVVRLSSVPIPAQVNSSESSVGNCKQLGGPNEVKEEDLKVHLGCKNDGSALSDESCTDFSDLSWVGNIIGLKNGDIEVMWADGMISMVGPQAIYVVGRDDDESMAASGSDISDDAASWETVEDDELNNLENPKQDLGAQSATDISIETENSGVNGALATAFGFVSRLASGIFSRERKKTDSPNSDSRSEDEIQNQGWDRRMDTGDDKCCQRPSDMGNIGTLSIEKREDNDAVEDIDPSDVAEALSNMKAEPTNASVQHKDGTYAFKNFDITTDPHDHYFVGASTQNNAGRKWLRKVQQDWIFLQNNLPDGIFVRVYEDRMDLMRAVIVGAYGTPYQDGLFFFDFHLPPEYPDIAPSAYYHSGGWRVNPNLYEEGKVCLSLLNTWTGRGNEIWDPSSSSIFQVLVSLQGLVLNARPYFNEAGYDKQIGTAEGEKNSLSYNENTFLLNCKTMMYLMRKPLKDFEDLVKEHFRRRGYYILKACDAYMKGYLIGSLTPDASVSSNNSAHANSVGFKLMLAKIVPKLFLALSEIGADCEEFKHLLHSAP